jgi:hypothetical protein
MCVDTGIASAWTVYLVRGILHLYRNHNAMLTLEFLPKLYNRAKIDSNSYNEISTASQPYYNNM